MERANEDSHLEGLKVVPPQDVEQIRADKLNNETAGKAGIKKRMGSLETCANLVLAQVGWEDRAKILRCEGSEEASLIRGWGGLGVRETSWRCGDLRRGPRVDRVGSVFFLSM